MKRPILFGAVALALLLLIQASYAENRKTPHLELGMRLRDFKKQKPCNIGKSAKLYSGKVDFFACDDFMFGPAKALATFAFVGDLLAQYSFSFPVDGDDVGELVRVISKQHGDPSYFDKDEITEFAAKKRKKAEIGWEDNMISLSLSHDDEGSLKVMILFTAQSQKLS